MHPRNNKLYSVEVVLEPYSKETFHVVAKDFFSAPDAVMKHFPDGTKKLRQILLVQYICNYVIIDDEVKPEED